MEQSFWNKLEKGLCIDIPEFIKNGFRLVHYYCFVDFNFLPRRIASNSQYSLLQYVRICQCAQF